MLQYERWRRKNGDVCQYRLLGGENWHKNTTLSERTFDQLHFFFKEHDYPQKRLVPFFSMVQVQKVLHKKTMESMRSRYKNFMETFIPFSIDVESMGEHQAPVDVYARNRPANKAYLCLWKEMVPLIRTA